MAQLSKTKLTTKNKAKQIKVEENGMHQATKNGSQFTSPFFIESFVVTW